MLAEITKNLAMASDPACLLIDISTPEGQATGRIRDSVVFCLLLVTVYADSIPQIIGRLSPTMKQELDNCLKAALALP